MTLARRPGLLLLTSVLALAFASAGRAQSTTPATSLVMPPQTFAAGGPSVTIDLKNHFILPNVNGQIVQIETVRGKFNIELLANDAPRTVANFLNYVNRGAYTNTLFHRSVPGFVIQAGGFSLVGNSINPIAQDPTVQNEFKVPNTRGTLAMAKTAAGPSTATNQWFVNLADNRSNLDNQNGGFTVFARVLGTGMSVADNIAAIPVYDARTALSDGTFDALPLLSNTISPDTLVLVRSVKPIPVYPASNADTAVLAFSVVNPATSIVNASVSGSALTLTPGVGGTVTLTVRATDGNGNAAESSFLVTNNAARPAPLITTQPVAQTVAAGSTVVFNAASTGAPTYQWLRNGTEIPGATSATFVVTSATAAADAGSYTVRVTNPAGSDISKPAALAVTNVTATEAGRLVNLSILTTAGTGAKILTVGAVIGPLSFTESLPLVMRGVGPGLSEFFGLNGVLADPTMTIFSEKTPDPIATNDNWGSTNTTILSSAFTAVGAFPLSLGSLDSAFVTPAPGFRVGGYTVQVAGKGNASGTVIAEIYDAAGTARTATTPRLVNLSTRAQLDPGGELRVGFVLRGLSSRTVLVRAVGPSLSALGVTGVMADPKLELFDNDRGGIVIGENDNWGGDRQIRDISLSTGAFALAAADSKDAVLLVTLPAGAYSARLSGVGGAGGTAIVEVYEVP